MNAKLIHITLFLILQIFQISILSQTEDKEKIKRQILSKTDTLALKKIGEEYEKKYQSSKAEAIKLFREKGYPIKKQNSDGSTFELQGIEKGRPIFYKTYSRIAAHTTSTNKVWNFSLNGAGIELGIWDENAVDVDHKAFREGSYEPYHAYLIDNGPVSVHATHVAGIMIADQDDNDPNGYNAKGMADKSVLYSWNWNSDISEMTNAAAGLNSNLSYQLILSNHSYGSTIGFDWGDYRNSGTDAWYWLI